MTIYVITADGEVDIIEEGAEAALAHMEDLIELGCTVKSYPFPDWPAAQKFADELAEGVY